MLRATVKSLLSHKLRLLLSGLAVALGVLAVSGALVLTSTLSRTYTDMFSTAYDSIDVSVTARPKVDLGYSSAPTTLPADLVDRLRAVPGVARVTGSVSSVDGARVVGPDGKVLTSFGAPRFGVNWTGEDDFVALRTGRGPLTDDEVVINGELADATGSTVGDRIDVVTLEPRRGFTIVGVFGYAGDRNSLAGETMVAFTTPAAQRLLLGEENVFTSVDLRAAAGVTEAQLRDRVTAELGGAYRVQTGAELTAEAGRQLDEGLRFFNYILLGFAFVALFVGVFLIVNTFSIVVAQRVRELALMRAMGASRGQLLASVEFEALLVGVVASVVGLLLGIGTGRLLAWLYATYLGGGVTLAPLAVPLSAVVGGLGVGIGVTVVAALLPALRAARVAPVAAMQESAAPGVRLSRIAAVGGAVTVVGAATMLAGLTDRAGEGNSLIALLVGLLVTLVGITALTPALARPVVAALGAVFRRWTPGRLGERNSTRNPRRTAITAAALMIGIALITGINVILTSVTRSVEHVMDDRISAELIIAGDPVNGLRPNFDTAVLDRARALPGVDAVLGTYADVALVDGEQTLVVAVTDSTTMHSMFGMTVTAGSLDGLGAGEFVIDEKTAAGKGLHVGDTVPVQLTKGAARTFTVKGIYEQTAAGSGWMTSAAEAANFRAADPSMGFVDVAPGASVATVKAHVADLLADSPEVSVADRSGFVRQQTRVLDTVLAMVQILMALSIVIAVLGIVNTLALSVIERTREFGLLRAIGLGRGQMMEMVGAESVLISVFGAVLGLVVGVGLGVAVVLGLRDEGITTIALPWSQMATYLVLGAVIGLVAAVLPAIRAARLDVLNAIAYE
ncbi:ABC transporter permease [Virgisporangium ochraceum]|uniref:ABC transporter n=1 Tax=Virgisporangium ochraceum TaxID=65505 RepID=A0A8J4EGW5_9ACTN|nr:ABC transporter permease [Virgisporangium ochraceum]GIJ71577.1 ABC transporter [Virgisporangium ochraceum]